LIGDGDAFKRMAKAGVLERAVNRIKQGIEYTEAPQKFPTRHSRNQID
jgi:hypothetical protein